MLLFFLVFVFDGCFCVIVVPSPQYNSVQSALDAALITGDAIQIQSGTYPCGFTAINPNILDPNKNLTISAITTRAVIFDCQRRNRTMIIQNLSHLVLDGLIFTGGAINTTDGGGGALLISNVQNVVIANCSFRDNIVFDSNNITDPNTPGGASGGAVLLTVLLSNFVQSVDLRSSDFVGNSVQNGDGGALSVLVTSSNGNRVITNVSVQVKGGTFENNQCSKAGGALSVNVYNDATDCDITVQDQPSFFQNSAGEGGGVQLRFNGDVVRCNAYLIGGTFFNGAAQAGGGGAAMVLYNAASLFSNIVIRNGYFFGNKCSRGGGSLIIFLNFAQNSSVEIDQVEMHSSYSGLGGGGIFIGATSDSIGLNVEISNSMVRNNSANGVGGGVAIVLPSEHQLIKQCLYCDPITIRPPPHCGFPQSPTRCSNALTSSFYTVNAVFIPFARPNSVTLHNVTVLENQAMCSGCTGGGLFFANGNVVLNTVLLAHNQAFQRGGGLFVTGTAELRFAGAVTIVQNAAGTLTDISVNSQGSVTIDKDANIEISCGLPQSYDFLDGSVITVDFSETGNNTVNPGGSFNLRCPRGFLYRNISLGIVSTYSAGWPNLMLMTSVGASCNPCPIFTYSLDSGGVQVFGNGSSIRTITCLRCPFGGNCSTGADLVLAVQDFWGVKVSSNQFPGAFEWKFTQCPVGYCCQSAQGCLPFAPSQQQNNNNSDEEFGLESLIGKYASTVACSYGRDASVPLCGACLEGYSQNLSGRGCTKNEDCNDGRWLWPILAVIGLAWAILIVVNSKIPSENDPTISMKIGWVMPVAIFYFQNISLLYSVQGSQSKGLVAAITLRSITTTVANLHLSSPVLSSSVEPEQGLGRGCVLEDLSTEGGIAMQLVLPLAVAILMCITFVVITIVNKFKLKWNLDHLGGRFGPSMLKLVLLFYTSIASVTGILLHCVPVDGFEGKTFLFRSGSVECFTWWQDLLRFALVIISLFPFAMVAVQLHVRRKTTQHSVFETLGGWLSVIERPYRKERWYWPSIVLIKRLLIVLLHSFEIDPSVQGIWFVIMFVFFLFVNVTCKPHRTQVGDAADNISLATLAITSLCIIRSGTLFEAAVLIQDTGTHAASISLDLDVVQAVIFFVPIIGIAAALAIEWKLTKNRLGGDKLVVEMQSVDK